MSGTSGGRSIINNRILIILGMHRSGTSMTAQWLHACGLNLGDKTLGAHESNPMGHYEDLDFLQLHENILIDNGLNDSGLEGDLNSICLSDYHKKRIKHLCYLKNDLHKQWGWKEPRTCLFIGEYVNYITQAKILIVYRDLAEVRTSLIKREVNEILRTEGIKFFTKLKLKLFRKYYRNKWSEILNLRYSNANTAYHQRIIDFINTTKNDLIIVNQKDLCEKDNLILSQLSSWGFSLQNVPFSHIFNEKIYNKRDKVLDKYAKMSEEEAAFYNQLELLQTFT